MKYLSSLIVCLCIASSLSSQPRNHNSKIDPSFWENPEREPLRKEMERLLGDLKGKTLLDIGAGAGYFAFEYAKKADKVIATELNEQYVDYMLSKKKDLKQKNVIIKKAYADQRELKNLVVDLAIMVNVVHHLDNPEAFLSNLKRSMNPGGKLLIAESGRILPDVIKQDLINAGFKDIEVRDFTYHVKHGELGVKLFISLIE